jgi:hypothetical protein
MCHGTIAVIGIAAMLNVSQRFRMLRLWLEMEVDVGGRRAPQSSAVIFSSYFQRVNAFVTSSVCAFCSGASVESALCNACGIPRAYTVRECLRQ